VEGERSGRLGRLVARLVFEQDSEGQVRLDRVFELDSGNVYSAEGLLVDEF